MLELGPEVRHTRCSIDDCGNPSAYCFAWWMDGDAWQMSYVCEACRPDAQWHYEPMFVHRSYADCRTPHPVFHPELNACLAPLETLQETETKEVVTA